MKHPPKSDILYHALNHRSLYEYLGSKPRMEKLFVLATMRSKLTPTYHLASHRQRTIDEMVTYISED